MSTGILTLSEAQTATDGQTPGKSVVASFGENPQFVAGRRAWVKYRELGVTQATGGAMRAQVIHAGTSNQATGWHLHRCDTQFLYVISGAIHIAFNPETIFRLQAGDSLMIPGGTVHYELGLPEGVEVLEISLPADMGTENVASPWGDADLDFSKAGTRPATAA